jgi:hypothetical protein
MSFIRLDNKWLIWPLFLFLMSYAILRAWFVEPLFDELATLYWYIQTGFLPGRGATTDANNHILNSLISHQFFKLFGDHFMAYRLFALSTFPIYFFACRNFLLKSATRFSVLIFLALVSVHWIFDYFSFSRGYGPSLAFLLLAFCFIQKWLYSFKTRSFIALIFFFILALLSNLSLLIPLFILSCFLIFSSIIHFKKFTKKQLVGFWITTLFFLAFLVPVFIYINKLKKAGALWWGSSEGLWEVTGKSLCENIFFSNNELWKYVFILLFVILSGIYIRNWATIGLKTISQQAIYWIPGLFAATVIAFVLMEKVMHVNYPMDRVGMYLVPLFILTFGLLLQKISFLKWSLLLLLWFPLSFLSKINLNTSIFSPEDRIHHSFYKQILQIVPEDATISADYVSQASYAYLSRSESIPHLATDYLPNDTLSRGDFHISWVDKLNWPNYTCVLVDSISGTRLYKRNPSFEKRVLIDTLIYPKKTKELVISILDLNLERYKNKRIQTEITGKVQLANYSLELNLRHEIQSQSGEIRRVDNTRFNWYFGRKTTYQFQYPNHLIQPLSDDKFLHIRFFNDDMKQVLLKAIHVKINEVTEKIK